jgi:AAA domain-containing protein
LCKSSGDGTAAPLTIVSGRDFPLVLATANGSEITCTDHIEYLEGFYGGDVIILDPFVSVHQCPENDNSLIDAVVKRLARAAVTGGAKAIELVHHARKPAQGGHIEIGAADARGASALGDGVRSLRMLNRMTESEALRAKVENARNYFRLDNGKSNYAAPSEGSQWFRHMPVLLPNGDDVGIVVPWHFPGAFDGVTAAHMQQVRDLARSGQYRADPRSPDWIGGAVAEVLDLDTESDGNKKRIKIILKEMVRHGRAGEGPETRPRSPRLLVRGTRKMDRSLSARRVRELLFRTPAQLPQTARRGRPVWGGCGSAGVRCALIGAPNDSRISRTPRRLRESRMSETRRTSAKNRKADSARPPAASPRRPAARRQPVAKGFARRRDWRRFQT